MTAPLIAPLIPPRARPGARPHGRPATPRRLPVAVAPEVPAVPDDVLYGFGRMDSSGRVADRAMTSALGWQPGYRLTLTIVAVVCPLRRCCGLRPGDRVLLAVFPDRDMLAVYSFAVVGTRRAYGSYWNRVVEHWGGRRLDEPTPSQIRQLMAYVKTHVVARRNARGGRSAQEHLVAALRCLYQRAIDDGLITEANNPARKVAKPRRLPSTRRAVPDTRLAEINETAAATGDDPELDTLLLRLHTETACRRGGALALRPRDLDPDQCLILLGRGARRSAGSRSPHLDGPPHRAWPAAACRAGRAAPRYTGGRPITSRRYDHLWGRIGPHLPWVATQQVSMHWIRHTTLTWVERRNFGYAVARAYACHPIAAARLPPRRRTSPPASPKWPQLCQR